MLYNIALMGHCVETTMKIVISKPDQCIINNIIIIIIKKGAQCKAGRDRSTPSRSEDPSPTIKTDRKKEEKTVEDTKRTSSLGQ